MIFLNIGGKLWKKNQFLLYFVKTIALVSPRWLFNYVENEDFQNAKFYSHLEEIVQRSYCFKNFLSFIVGTRTTE